MSELNMKILELLPQECEDEAYEFESGFIVATRGFINVFYYDIERLIPQALQLIKETFSCADYLQTFKYDGIKFWVISSALVGEPAIITFLLPEEY